MEVQFKRKNPFEVLGLREDEISLNKIEEAYRKKRQQLDDLGQRENNHNQALYDEIEKAFQELVNYLDDDTLQDQEEVVISAAFLPKKSLIYKQPHQEVQHSKLPALDFEEDSQPIYDKIIEKKSILDTRPPLLKPVESIMNAKVVPTKGIRAEAARNPELFSVIEKMIENAKNIDGLFLKKIREKMEVTLEEMSLKIKVSKSYLEAIETDHFENLPAEVYTKGFFHSYLNYLGVDKKELVEALMEIYRSKKRLIKKK